MARVGHCTVLTTAAAARLALLLVFNKTYYDSRYNSDNDYANYNCCNIL